MFPLKKVVSQRFTVYPKKNVVFKPWVLTNVCQHWEMFSKTKTTMFIHLLHHPQRHSFSITKMPVVSLFFLHHLMLFKQKNKPSLFLPWFFPGNICYFFPLVPIVFPMFFPMFIELDDGKIYRKTLYLMVKTMVSCRFSLKSIQWHVFFPTNPAFSHGQNGGPFPSLGDAPWRASAAARCPRAWPLSWVHLSTQWLRWLTKAMVGLYNKYIYIYIVYVYI